MTRAELVEKVLDVTVHAGSRDCGNDTGVASFADWSEVTCPKCLTVRMNEAGEEELRIRAKELRPSGAWGLLMQASRYGLCDPP